jgi:hypothetical protein
MNKIKFLTGAFLTLFSAYLASKAYADGMEEVVLPITKHGETLDQGKPKSDGKEICTFSYTGKSDRKNVETLIDALYGKVRENVKKDIDKTKLGNWIKTSYGANDLTSTLMYSPIKGLYFKDTVNYFNTSNIPDIKVSSETAKFVSSRKPSVSFDLLGSLVDNDAKTRVYDYEAKGSGLGAKISAENVILGKNCFLDLSVDALNENLKTSNVLTGNEAGNMQNERRNIEFAVDKEYRNVNATLGGKVYNYITTEDYSGVKAESSIKLAGLDYGIDYTHGQLTLGYEGETLADNGSSDVKKIVSNAGKVKVGPLTVKMKSSTINGNGPAIQQLYQQGVFPSEISAEWEGKGYSVSVSQLRDYDTSASSVEYGFKMNLTKNIGINYSHVKAERDSKGKKTASERNALEVEYTFK